MNLYKKLELAHEYAVEILKATHANHGFLSEIEIENITETSWALSDAMEAEYNKRKTTGLPEVLQDEFQVDWSVAPDWAVAWTIDKNAGLWWSDMPKVHRNIWFIDGGHWQCADASSFNYQGDWKYSLRKRPNT